MRKKDFSLLPYIKDPVYGFDNSSAQILGWELSKFNIPELWTKTQGDGVKVSVVDTGCDFNHTDLKKNLLPGKNFVQHNKDPQDDNGHGTHVSGTIGAENNGFGMVGIAPKCSIIPVKALDSTGNGNSTNIANAIVWSAESGADFITMSLGSKINSSEIYRSILHATKLGSIIVCAAGNSGKNSPISYPAKYNETIAIGSINENLQRSNFSCSGEELDFLCPGEKIFSCVPNNSYAIMSGTSMSTPFAVGCFALLLSYKRKLLGQTYRLKQIDYINIFKNHTKNLDNYQYNNKKYQGYGILYPVIQ